MSPAGRDTTIYEERVAGLYEEIASRSEEIEQLGELPNDIVQKLKDAGIFRMLVPVELGGGEVHPSQYIRTLEALSAADGSTGWCAMISGSTGALAASMPEETAALIYGPADAATCGVLQPKGRADVVEGGFRVSGRWPFGSGIKYSEWICGGSVVHEDGAPRKLSNGVPEVQLMIFSAEDVQVQDTWQVAGLSGTGSHHFEVDDVFVSDSRAILLGGRARVRRPLYQFPLLGLLAIGVSAVALGIAARALTEFRSLAGEKKPTGATRPLAERATVQEDVALSEADLGSARAYLHAAIDEAWAVAETGERIPLGMKAALRLAANNATRRSAEVVDRLYTAAGGTSPYMTSPLQRCLRDIHVVTQHAMVARPLYEVTGRVFLGLDPKSPL